MMTATEKNLAFFDDLASLYEVEDSFIELTSQTTRALREHIDWIGINENKETPSSGSPKIIRLLDYACGPGLISRALAPFMTQLVGIDLSPKMVEQYNKHGAASVIPMSAVQGNLFAPTISPELSNAKFFNFDIIGVGYAFHHFEDVELATRRLAERLAPGGILLIVDFVHDEKNTNHHHHHHGHHHGHHHHHNNTHDIPTEWQEHAGGSITAIGFNEVGIGKLFADCGLVDFKFQTLPEKAVIKINGILERDVFFACARKSVA